MAMSVNDFHQHMLYDMARAGDGLMRRYGMMPIILIAAQHDTSAHFAGGRGAQEDRF